MPVLQQTTCRRVFGKGTFIAFVLLRSPSRSLPSPSQDAGWSSLVARQAHNLKAAGSNPAPATTEAFGPSRFAISPGLAFAPPHPAEAS